MKSTLPWFVLLVAGVQKQTPFLEPFYNTLTILVYSLCISLYWVVSHDEKWRRKLHATNSTEIVRFQLMEFAAALPMSFATVYLLFDTLIPFPVFWVALFTGTVAQRWTVWIWERQMQTLLLG